MTPEQFIKEYIEKNTEYESIEQSQPMIDAMWAMYRFASNMRH